MDKVEECRCKCHTRHGYCKKDRIKLMQSPLKTCPAYKKKVTSGILKTF